MAGKTKQGNESAGATIAVNKKARFEYQIDEEFEAGLVLLGTEVKSLRASRANIADSYAGPKAGELMVFNLHIPEYAHGNRHNHEPRRPRKLLLHKKEVNKLLGKLKNKGVTLIPLKLYFNARGIAKLKIGLATGKKQHEKRQTIKDRDWQRDKARIIRDNNKN